MEKLTVGRLCIIAISIRLAFTPKDYFNADWTFNDILPGMLFQIELNLVTMTVLAPNLPVFFQKTSTGGVYFLPGEAIGGSRSGTNPSNSVAAKVDCYALSNKTGHSTRVDGGVYTSKGDGIITSRATRGGEGRHLERRASFNSHVILMRRSVEVERVSDGEASDHYKSIGEMS